MTLAQVLPLAAGIAVVTFVYWRWILSQNDREVRTAWRERGTNTYEVTQTGSLFVPRFDRYVEAGATLYIPAGDGLYPRRIKNKRAASYRAGLHRWLTRGAKVNIIVSSPNPQAYVEWRPLKDRFPSNLEVFFLHREKASGLNCAQTAAQIATLDTFHPVILDSPPNSVHSGAMWIEHLHPLESKYAYRVEFIDPADPVDQASSRKLETYLRTYEVLLSGDHVESLDTSEAVEPAREAA